MGNKSLFDRMPGGQFGIGGNKTATKKLVFNPDPQPPQTVVEIATNPNAGGDINLVLPATSGTLALEGGGGGGGRKAVTGSNGGAGSAGGAGYAGQITVMWVV